MPNCFQKSSDSCILFSKKKNTKQSNTHCTNPSPFAEKIDGSFFFLIIRCHKIQKKYKQDRQILWCHCRSFVDSIHRISQKYICRHIMCEKLCKQSTWIYAVPIRQIKHLMTFQIDSNGQTSRLKAGKLIWVGSNRKKYRVIKICIFIDFSLSGKKNIN
jgi:hypothetical protein